MDSEISEKKVKAEKGYSYSLKVSPTGVHRNLKGGKRNFMKQIYNILAYIILPSGKEKHYQ